MIAEIRFKNMFSFRDEAILSFEAVEVRIWSHIMLSNWGVM